MKFDIVADGGHKAQVVITPHEGGVFAGQVISTDYGTGSITNGKIEGNTYTGNVNLAGYTADFSATLDGDKITGRLKYGWFFDKEFAGQETSVV